MNETRRLRHQFSVEIETTNPELIEAYSVLEKQLVSFDIGTENLGVPMLSHVKKSVILWLQDDVNSELMTSLRKIQKYQDQFNVVLNILRNKSISEQYLFNECRCSALQHSILSYESSEDSISLKSETNSYKGTLKAASARNHTMKLLQIEFNNYDHRILI